MMQKIGNQESNSAPTTRKAPKTLMGDVKDGELKTQRGTKIRKDYFHKSYFGFLCWMCLWRLGPRAKTPGSPSASFAHIQG